MKSVWMTIQVLLVLAVLLIPAVAGEVYTWTDADGNIHITDRPPAANAPVERVIRYSSPTRTAPPPDPVPRQDSVDRQQAEQLNRQLTRLKERKAQLEKIISENQASIADAEKDAAYYRKRSGSYARRNEKSIERQLVVLANNLATYQSDQRYVQEDILEIEKLLETIELKRIRQEGESGSSTQSN
jgi:predicted RNase H-like nuclease (RuvC/YqgF family)